METETTQQHAQTYHRTVREEQELRHKSTRWKSGDKSGALKSAEEWEIRTHTRWKWIYKSIFETYSGLGLVVERKLPKLEATRGENENRHTVNPTHRSMESEWTKRKHSRWKNDNTHKRMKTIALAGKAGSLAGRSPAAQG